MPRTCVYCDNPTGDPEHAWPRWLQQWLNPDRVQVPVLLATGKIVPNKGWDLATTGLVCTPCNRWMDAKFERKAAPLIKTLDTATPHTLTPKEQRALASWVYKTAIMLECTGGGDPGVSQQEFRRFRSSGEPPPNCSIVMGVSLYPVLAYHRTLMGQRDPPEPSAGYLSLIVVAHVFFHIIGDAKVVNGHDAFAPAAVGVHFHRIWPGTGKMLKWPFDRALAKEALVDLANWGGGTFGFVV